jgi:hypothetical protein
MGMGDTATNLHVCTLMQVRKNVPCAPFVTEIRVTFAKTGSGQPCGKHRFCFKEEGVVSQNAFIMSGEEKFKAWLLDYVGGAKNATFCAIYV